MADRVAGDVVRYGKVDREYGVKLFTTPPEDDGPIWMVNLMSYREKADYADGRESNVTGREADDLYAPLGPLKEIGADHVPQLLVFNKVDRMGREAAVEHDPCGTLSAVYVSAETGAGLDLLRAAIAERARSARVADALPDDLETPVSADLR